MEKPFHPDLICFNLGVDINMDDSDEEGTSRFASVTASTVEDMSKKKTAKKTAEVTTFGVNILKTYCQSVGEEFPSKENTTELQLAELLSRFYIAARTRKGEMYKLNTLKSVRFSLQRHFTEHLGIDIIDNSIFRETNTIFDNVQKQTKVAGKGETEHHPELEPEDVRKLVSSIDVSSPVGLLEYCWFNILYYGARRGQQNVQAMTKASYTIRRDATGP